LTDRRKNPGRNHRDFSRSRDAKHWENQRAGQNHPVADPLFGGVDLEIIA